MKIMTTVAAALILGVAAPALAETNSVRVSYADLNLRSEAGVKVLQRRLARAVVHLCGDYAAIPSSDWRSIRQCRNEAKKSIEPQLARAMQKSMQRDDTRLASTR